MEFSGKITSDDCDDDSGEELQISLTFKTHIIEKIHTKLLNLRLKKQ